MSTFRYANLMIQVLPETSEPIAGGRTLPCAFHPGSIILNPPTPCGFHPASVILNPPTPCALHGSIHFTPTACPHPASYLPPACAILGSIIPVPTTPVTNPGPLEASGAELRALHQQLVALTDQVKQRLDAEAAAAKPQTLAEAEGLETQLKGALAELQKQKAALHHSKG